GNPGDLYQRGQVRGQHPAPARHGVLAPVPHRGDRQPGPDARCPGGRPGGTRLPGRRDRVRPRVPGGHQARHPRPRPYRLRVARLRQRGALMTIYTSGWKGRDDTGGPEPTDPDAHEPEAADDAGSGTSATPTGAPGVYVSSSYGTNGRVGTPSASAPSAP